MKHFIPLSLAVAMASAAADERAIEHVLVTVPLHKQAAQTALPVTVLSGDELRRSASTSIGDTLNGNPGLANASFGPGVGRPVIRGQQGARVMVLQNSTSSADVSGLSADHAVSVEPMLAESIEVLRGPSTLLYGGGAIGGVINVIDNRIPDTVPEAISGGVEYRYVSASDMHSGVFKLDGGAGNWAYHLDGMYRDWDDLDIPGRAVNEPGVESTDGDIANTGGDTSNLSGGVSYHFIDGFVGFSVTELDNRYGIPPGAHEHHEDEEEEDHEEEVEEVTLDIDHKRYSSIAQFDDPLASLETVRAFLTYNDYQHREIEGDGVTGTQFDRKTWEGRLEVVHAPVAGFHGVFGLQASSDEFSAVGEESYIPTTDSSALGVFLLEDRHVGDWIFEGGLRYDWTERDPNTSVTGTRDFNAFSASISALWQFASQWQAGLALSSAERAPVDEELYSNVEASSPDQLVVHAATNAIEVGDPDLDTETSYNADLSLRWSDGDNFIQLSGFYNDFSDYINLRNTGLEQDEVPIYAYGNDDAEFYGGEFDSEFALIQLAGGDIRLGVFADVVYGQLDQGGDVPRLPPARIGSRLSWSLARMEFWTQVQYADDQDKPGDFERVTQSYTRWDVGGEYRLPLNGSELIAFFEVENIGNEEIRLSTSFLRDVAPESGVSVSAGLRYLF